MASADLCTRLARFFNVSQLLCDLFTWMFNADGTFSSSVTNEIAAVLRPPGEIAWSASPSMGSGWLLCDGSAVSRTTYANLFSAIGTRYGAGDGSTTFTLPDFRGRSPIGAGTGAGLSTRDVNTKYIGEETHTQTIAEMPSHTHAFDTSDGQLMLVHQETNNVNTIDRTGSLKYAYADPLQNTGGGSPFNVVHPCMILYTFVKT